MKRDIDVTFFELCEGQVIPDWYFNDYCSLMKQLHGVDCNPSLEIFKKRLGFQSEILQVGLSGDTLIACAQASFSLVDPVPKVHIENVVVDERYRGEGNGWVLMQGLLMSARAKWSRYSRDGRLRFELTNSPKKENARFYERLCFSPRTEEVGDPTVVWVMMF